MSHIQLCNTKTMTKGICVKCFSLCIRQVSGKRHEPKKKKKNKQRSIPELNPHIRKEMNKITSKSYCLDFFFCNFYWLTLFFCHENQELPYHFGILHDSLQVHSLTICKQSVSNTIYGTISTADKITL